MQRRRLFYISFLVLIHIASTGCCQEKVVTIPEQILNRQKVVFTTPPSRIPVPHSVDAPLLGNGFTGVAISGNPEKQVYHISRNDFWRLKSSFNNSFPAVLGTVEVSIPGLTGASYLIEQDLYKAKTLSSFAKKGQNVLFRTFVSATEDLMVVEIILTGEGELEGTINLDLPGPQQLIDNPPFDRVFPTETEIGNAADGIYYISRAFEEEVDIPTKAVCALTILGGKAHLAFDAVEVVIYSRPRANEQGSGDTLEVQGLCKIVLEVVFYEFDRLFRFEK